MHVRTLMKTGQAVACGVAILMAGCSAGALPVGSVSGTVTAGGKPLTAGTIGFIALDGKPYQSDISPTGTYRVDNVPPGEAIVVVHAPMPNEAARHQAIKETKGQPPAPPPLPFAAKYSDFGTTDLRFTIKEGENQYSPDLKK